MPLLLVHQKDDNEIFMTFVYTLRDKGNRMNTGRCCSMYHDGRPRRTGTSPEIQNELTHRRDTKAREGLFGGRDREVVGRSSDGLLLLSFSGLSRSLPGYH